MLQSLSYAFDFGVWEILTTLISGATLYVPQEAGDAEAYGRRALELGIDTVHATPSFFRAVARTGVVLEGLRTLHLGGEALVRSEVEELARAVGTGCRLYNGYGPTEVTVNSLLFEIGTKGALRGGRGCRSAGRRRSTRCTCWTAGASRRRWGWRASCGWVGRGWRAATWGVRS